MPRHRRLRKVVAPPGFHGFKPYGVVDISQDKVELLYEEYEAIKLSDYDGLNHENASKLMGVSRPTFARIYESARKKIATAFVEKKEIKSVYGNALLDENWYLCNECNARFTIPRGRSQQQCALCSSANTKNIKGEK
ncbi:MAG: UPF0251 protein [Melioribacteraceae bacterium]|nr:MAG: UPF0251 protein [Melioribacteraceae bacterium]